MKSRKGQRKRKKEKGTRYFDYNLLFIVIFLMCFGLVMLYSSSAYTSANKFGDSAYYLKLQMRNMLVGAIPMIILAASDYHKWKKWGLSAYIVSFLLCCAVLIPGVGSSSHGSARWLPLGPLTFQPSELAKFSVILFLAMFLEKVPKSIAKFSGLIKTMVTLIPIVGIIAYQNLSTAVIVLGVAVCMVFVVSPKYLQFIIIGAVGIVFIAVFTLTVGYRGTRFEAWLYPETAGAAGYQTMQGLYAIGSGGLVGKGLGESIQKMGNVPETQNDMIFSIICEELGLFGAICVILLYILLLWRMMVIANNATDLFGALLVSGIMSHIAIQVILNIAVVTNTIPNTGVTLPFFSYGGTSIVFLMSEIGLVFSVSKGIRLTSIE